MKYYGHSNKEKGEEQWQLLKDHLEETGKLAANFARAFGAENIAYTVGILHDLGKYSLEFQKRIRGDGVKVDHSTSGALEAAKRYGNGGNILAYTIAGHHCGLPDWGSSQDDSSLAARLNKKVHDYKAFSQEIELLPPEELKLPPLRPSVGLGFTFQFFIRLIYSCLVDADFLDTERFLNPEKFKARNKKYLIKELSDKLERHLDILCSKSPETFVNIKRNEILKACREKSGSAPGLFSLTVPTGGGKTLSSLSFALKHAVKHDKERVIYVIPYTSIIEQNAAVFRKILGEEHVLEHHSNFSHPQDEQLEAKAESAMDIMQFVKLASENWDMPIIATTNVQFFESLFAAKSSRCRKLHNLVNSVIVIDEAQMLPNDFLKPCLSAIAELITNYKATVVLCTATQPAINKLLPEGIKPIEIIDNPIELYQAFKRVRVYSLGTVPDDELAEQITLQEQVLCIVNSKKHARLLYERIQGEGTFHLSTRMCPAHRTTVLELAKQRLKEGLTCKVISTQLIEAGVDIDFPVVYRSMAGIDSLAQSAGRCNREGQRSEGKVFVFKPGEKHGMPRGWLSRTATLGEGVIKKHEDPLGLEAVKEYFSSLYDIDAGELDKENILKDIREQEGFFRFPFRSIANKFKLMEENTSTIVIPWDHKCQKILEEARYSPFPGAYTRSLQRYGVQVFEREFTELYGLGVLENINNRFFVLKDEMLKGHYSQETGLIPKTESMFLNDTLII